MLQHIKKMPATLSAQVHRVLAWFQDDVFRRLFLNAGKLLSGEGFAAVIGFVSTTITARALGPENYGILALVLTYKATVGTLVSFNAWQAIIKFGSEAQHKKDAIGLKQLLKFGFLLDVGSAFVGTILAISVSGLTINVLGWDPAIRNLLMLYSILILFSLSGTPIGVLRLYDRFDLLSYTSVLGALARLVGVTWCFLTGQGLLSFVVAYLIGTIIGNLYQLFASLWVIRKRNLLDFVYTPLHGIRQRFTGIWDFVWTTNFNSTIRLLSREADGLIIAGFTTPNALGLYKIAKQFSKILPMLVNPLLQSIYPELARLWSARTKRRFVSLIKRSTLFSSIIGGLGWLGFVVFGRWLINLTVGVAYQDAYWVTVFYMLALYVFLVSFAISPAMQAIGLVREVLLTTLVGTVVYFVLLFFLVPELDILGASLAYLGYFIVMNGIRPFYLLPHLRPT